MSKEKTLTAEELFSDIWKMINNDDNRRKELTISTRTILDIEDKIEKAFQAKVLEREKEIKQWLIDEYNKDLQKGCNI